MRPLPPPLPPWLGALLGDPESQALSLAQPLGLVRVFGPAGRRVVEYSAEDLLPRILEQLRAHPRAQELGRRAVEASGVERLAEAERPWLDEALRVLERGDPKTWGGLRSPDLIDARAVIMHPNKGVVLPTTVLDLRGGVARAVADPNLPQVLAHELTHALERGAGYPVPLDVLDNLIRAYRSTNSFGLYPAMQYGAPGEVLAEVVSRYLTGGEPTTRTGWEVVGPGVRHYTNEALRALGLGPL